MISVANDADVRNVFTAYVESAISRCKTRYLYKKYEYEKLDNRDISIINEEMNTLLKSKKQEKDED